MSYDDDEQDADDVTDRDDPIESDMDDNDDPEFIPCPHCGKSIGEEAERCHHCGMDVIHARSRRPLWITIAAILLLIAMLSWVF